MSEAITTRSGANTDTQVIEMWLATKRSEHTKRAYAADAAHLMGTISGLQGATAAELVAWMQSLTGSPRTVARRISSVKSLYSFAHRIGYCQYNTAAILVAPTVPNDLAERILDKDEVRQLLDAAQGRDRLLLEVLYLGGLRVSELCGLEWRHLHGSVLTVHGKGGKTRHVTLPGRLASSLEAERAEGSMFGITDSGVRKMLDRAAARAGLGEVSPHWLRHACASHALDAGAPVHVVQATLGHASLTTTSRYVHCRQGDSAGLYIDG